MKKNRKIGFLLISFLLNFQSFSQKVSVINFVDLSHLISQQNDTTYVVNFWATFCKPCVEELPHFDAINTKLRADKVKVILVSLDFVKDKSKVQKFIDTNHIKSTVVLLNEPAYDSWINKISTQWSGAIPATLLINNQYNQRVFFEQVVDYQILKDKIGEMLHAKR